MSARIYQLCQQLRETPLSDRLLRAWIRHQLRELGCYSTHRAMRIN